MNRTLRERWKKKWSREYGGREYIDKAATTFDLCAQGDWGNNTWTTKVKGDIAIQLKSIPAKKKKSTTT